MRTPVVGYFHFKVAHYPKPVSVVWFPGNAASATNPGPVKAAMAAMGLLEPVWRLPLVAPKQENIQRIERTLEILGLLGRVHAARAN